LQHQSLDCSYGSMASPHPLKNNWAIPTAQTLAKSLVNKGFQFFGCCPHHHHATSLQQEYTAAVGQNRPGIRADKFKPDATKPRVDAPLRVGLYSLRSPSPANSGKIGMPGLGRSATVPRAKPHPSPEAMTKKLLEQVASWPQEDQEGLLSMRAAQRTGLYHARPRNGVAIGTAPSLGEGGR
jgi:hypothetical protein